MSDTVKVVILTSGFLGFMAASFVLILAAVKFINQGTVVADGTVLATKSGIESCVEISKTTKGESANVTFCAFRSFTLPEIGDKVRVTYTKSPWLCMDTVEVRGVAGK